MNKNIYTAIAMTLYEYKGSNVHGIESGKITVEPKQNMWDAKFISFTKKSRQCRAK